MSSKLLIAVLFACSCLFPTFSSPSRAQESTDNPQLKAALKRFPKADIDQDGKLTMEEASAYLKRNGSRLLKRFPDADSNEDGKLSMSEVTRFLKQRTNQGDKKRGDAEPATPPKDGKRFVYKRVGKTELPLYVYGHSTGNKKPAVVFFFGGGWTGGSPNQFENQCKYLSKRGMVAVTVEYRVASRHDAKVEDCVEDAKSAMRWVRANASKLGVDPSRLASGGGSAGGHLAACTCLIDDFDAQTDDQSVSPKPNAMILFNPALVTAPDPRMTEEELKKIKEVEKRARTSMKNVSPINFVAKKQPPMIMFFGTEDRLLKGAELFQQDSEEVGNSCTLITYEGEGHGFFNRDKYRELTLAEVDKFLIDLGWIGANQE